MGFYQAQKIEKLEARIGELEALLSQTNEGYAECIATREDYRARIAELEAALREAYEVYAGSDGFIAETAAEGYLQQLISEMVAIIGAELKK